MSAPKFALDDLDRANEEWGANCGPGALAVILGLTLDEVRPLMGDFEQKHYTNPTLMLDSLLRSGRTFQYRSGHLGRSAWPHSGLARIQWEGPWTKPGVPARVAYRHTHWVASYRSTSNPDYNIAIFDINALGNGSGWTNETSWVITLAPWIIENCAPKGDGGWHITHSIEVAPS